GGSETPAARSSVTTPGVMPLSSKDEHLLGFDRPAGEVLHRAPARALGELCVGDPARVEAAPANSDECVKLRDRAEHRLDVVVARGNLLAALRCGDGVADQEDLELHVGLAGERPGEPEAVVGALAAVGGVVQDDERLHRTASSWTGAIGLGLFPRGDGSLKGRTRSHGSVTCPLSRSRSRPMAMPSWPAWGWSL